ncbi:uncharacterized protein LOC129730588 [Wyeomyia smithii]|uniref:uncharacterized protein LOC129730588 n=1 Tax=Wyeomyia smithii TaxID=174621 RepID=UPI002467F3D7|nr:uncharacterized protein LOC129730588 [Wyeomyia smithii]
MSTEEEFDQCLGSFLGNEQSIALLLDYDGALAEIPDRPELSVIPPETKETLRNIVNSGKAFVAIISGRSADDVQEKVGIANIIYSGNHGLEVLHPDGTRHNQAIPKAVSDNFDRMIDQLNEEVAHNGAWVQNKQFSISLHYRDMDPRLVPEMVQKARRIIESHGYRADSAYQVLDGNPPIEWNKGRAAEYILGANFDKDWKRRKVIFAGDDATDEHVMVLLKGSGKSFRITRGQDVESSADFKLSSTKSVYQMLKWLEKKLCV